MLLHYHYTTAKKVIESQEWGPSGEDTRGNVCHPPPLRSLSRVYPPPPEQGGAMGLGPTPQGSVGAILEPFGGAIYSREEARRGEAPPMAPL